MGPAPGVLPVYVRIGVSEQGLRMSAVQLTARVEDEGSDTEVADPDWNGSSEAWVLRSRRRSTPSPAP